MKFTRSACLVYIKVLFLGEKGESGESIVGPKGKNLTSFNAKR